MSCGESNICACKSRGRKRWIEFFGGRFEYLGSWYACVCCKLTSKVMLGGVFAEREKWNGIGKMEAGLKK